MPYTILQKPKKLFQKLNEKKQTKSGNRLKYAERKLVSICVGLDRIYQWYDSHKLTECLSTFKSKKLNFKNEIIQKYKYERRS